MTKAKLFAAIEFTALYILTPVILYFCATRWNVHIGLWIVSLYTVFHVLRIEKTPWKTIWNGTGWTAHNKKIAVLRFAIATAFIILLTRVIAPDRILAFPLQRPVFWLIVMVLYPVLSVLPQEFVFRSYFFRRYKQIFPTERLMQSMSALAFAFVHVVFHNPVSPTLCLIAGGIFAYSYSQHRSLKWAVIEHAAYGCMVFTIGIGYFFLVGGMAMRP